MVDVVDKYGGANLILPGTTSKPGTSSGIVFLAWGNWAAKRVARLSKVYTVYPDTRTLSHSLTDKTPDITQCGKSSRKSSTFSAKLMSS